MYEYCPKCGHKYSTGQRPYALHCEQCNYTFYLNSKPTASVLVIKNNKLLLGKRGIEPSKGRWDVIGGFLNFGEHPIDGAKREVKEETGLDIEPYQLLGFFMDTYGSTGDSTLNICFLGKVVGGTPKAGDDIVELQWFEQSEIPTEIAFENGQAMIDAWINIQ